MEWEKEMTRADFRLARERYQEYKEKCAEELMHYLTFEEYCMTIFGRDFLHPEPFPLEVDKMPAWVPVFPPGIKSRAEDDDGVHVIKDWRNSPPKDATVTIVTPCKWNPKTEKWEPHVEPKPKLPNQKDHV